MTQGRKSGMKREVDQLHSELDQIIKRIQEIGIKSVVPTPLLVRCSHTDTAVAIHRVKARAQKMRTCQRFLQTKKLAR